MNIDNWKIKWYLLAFISIVFFSVHAVTIRHLVFDNGMDPVLIAFLRLFIWWLFLLIILLIFFDKSKFLQLLNDKKLYNNKHVFYSVIFLSLNFIAFHIWLKYTLASDSILLETLAPVLVVLITIFLFWQQYYNLQQLKKIFLVVIIASVWSSLLIANNPNIIWTDYSNKIFWDLLEFLAMIFFAFFLVFFSQLRKSLPKENGLYLTTIVLLLSALLILPLSLLSFSQTWINTFELLDSESIILILLISIWSTWILYLCWFLASNYLNVITLAILFNITWLTTIIVEHIVYPEINLISWKLIVWWVLIIFASIYIEYLNTQRFWKK